jgi:hypothetical protein
MIKFILLFSLVAQGSTGIIALLCQFFPQMEGILRISFFFYFFGLFLFISWLIFSRTKPLGKKEVA